MGIVVRQSIKNSIVSYAGALIGMINVLILTPLYLSKAEIGLSRYMLDFSLLFAQFAQLGVPHMAVRFFSYFQNEYEKHRGFLAFLLLFPLVGFGVLCVAYVFFQPVFYKIYQQQSPELLSYYYFFLPLIFFIIYISILEAYARVQLRIVVPALIRELFLKLFNVAVIMLYGLRIIDFPLLVHLLILSYGIAVVMLVFYIHKLGQLQLHLDFSFIKTPVFRQMLSYGGFVLMGGAGTLFASKIDTLMVAAYKGGLDLTGIYALAFNIAMVIEIPRRAITQITTPLVADAWRRNDLRHIAELYQKSSLNQLIAGAFLFLGVWCNIDSIFEIIPNGASFAVGKWVVFIIAFGRLVDMANGINNEIVVNSRYYKIDLLTMLLLAFLTIYLNSILIPRYQIVGAALGTLFSVSAYNAIRTVFLWVKFRMQPFTQKTWITLGIGLVTFAAASLMPEFTGGFVQKSGTILLRSAVITIVYGGLVYWTGVSEELNGVVKQLLVRIKPAAKK